MTTLHLPETLPIFPLNDVILLPKGDLPLNIFEPRYIAMIDDALKSGNRLIGMIQPNKDKERSNSSGLQPLGTAGRIVSFRETNDQRYLITLRGVARFEVKSELSTIRGYRRIEADWKKSDLTQPYCDNFIDRDRLFSAMSDYFTIFDLTPDWQKLYKASDDSLIIALSMVCPFSPPEKQALLEAEDTLERSQILINFVEEVTYKAKQNPANVTPLHH